ncbi:MAG TPA: STAS domain-containing protein [Terriglobia bacterium]|nr:STAS domain-containing protein [Terriglobia bacterium]
MLTHTGHAFNGNGLFSMPGLDSIVSDRRENAVVVIDLAGPLVGERSVHALHDRIQELLLLGAKKFAINLAEVPYADSGGLSGLVAAHNLIQSRGAGIKFFATPARLAHTLARLRLDTVFELFGDESSALSSF